MIEKINMIAIKVSPSLFAYQIMLVCENDKKSNSTLLKSNQISDDYEDVFK